MHKLLLLLFTLALTNSFAQNVTVKGKCVNQKGKGVDFVKIRVNNSPNAIYTNESGEYVVPARVSDTLNLEYVVTDGSDVLVQRQTYIVGLESVQQFEPITFQLNTLLIDQMNVDRKIEKPFEIPPIELRNPRGIIEPIKTLVYTTAAVSNNELTSNYNVRGGNYDENLVYLNGYQIFRPFLTRAGQQEGMSFVNSGLVKSLRFSGGGFDSQYGDKLSSVLDIEYRNPDTLRGTVLASMLGVELTFEQQLGKHKNFSYMSGFRYRSNGYFLNSLPTKGSYNPVFLDGQILTSYTINEKWTWSVLGHYSSNNYRFIPQTSETDFGTANEAYRFNIYFDGQENTTFRTLTAGTKFAYVSKNKKTKLNYFVSVFNTDEREYFDVQGQYYINKLETDPSKEEFGDSIAVLGVGTFLNHARNRLKATIYSVYHTGDYEIFRGYQDDEKTRFRQHNLTWGLNFQHDDFFDVLSEWKLIDSAGYSLPQSNDHTIQLNEVIKGKLNLTAQRYTGFIQENSIWSRTKLNYPVSIRKTVKLRDGTKVKRIYSDTIESSVARWALSVGTRFGYTTANNEPYVTPRANVTYYPRAYVVKDSTIERRSMMLRLATGLYYQPPFYREFRTFAGDLNLGVKAQKSYHLVAGYDMFFYMWGRENPFKFTAEAYYKYLWDVNPYEIDNVRTRYYAENNAVAYAYGIDLNLNGEFIRGVESFFKVGLLSTKEDINNDSYKEYYNAAGDKIIFGISEDQTVVDSAEIFPGYIPRPTDQIINVGVLIQDQMPTIPAWTVQMGLQYGSSLPYGPPDHDRYKDTLRSKAYFRVDLGTSIDFLKFKQAKKNFINKNFKEAIVSFEVYNLLGINNVLSKQWIQGVDGTYYSIPNYLTQRRFNLKIIVRF